MLILEELNQTTYEHRGFSEMVFVRYLRLNLYLSLIINYQYILMVYISMTKTLFSKHPNKILMYDAPADGAEVVIQALKASEYQSVRSKTYVANGSQRIFSCGFTHQMSILFLFQRMVIYFKTKIM